MKKLLALLLLSPLAFAQQPNSNMNNFTLSCKVTGQVLIKTEDGVSTTAGHYKDGLEVGDTFSIYFSYSSSGGDDYSFLINSSDLNILISALSRNAKGSLVGLEYLYGSFDTINLSEGRLNIKNAFGEMDLKRYYKNDYELMHTEGAAVGFARRTLTANCMNMPTTYDMVMNLIKRKESEKWANYILE
tara:strand:+ start:38 stop:601 length:564 start_codon:yes stop_codon:yes gene_type:complete